MKTSKRKALLFFVVPVALFGLHMTVLVFATRAALSDRGPTVEPEYQQRMDMLKEEARK
ncbi:MAG: hypothetical protein AAGD32_04825 [Planctomycetota bacterium]